MELLSVALISVILLALFLPAFSEIYGANTAIANAPTAQANASDMATTIATALADAPVVGGICITAATATGVSFYSSPAGAVTKYSVAAGTFSVTENGKTTVLYTGATLGITYFKSATYNSSALAPFVPATPATLAQVVAVRINSSETLNGYSSSYSECVRLRNGPARPVSFS